MSTGKPRDPFKEQQWRSRLRNWQRSRLSVAAFCRRSGVAEQQFYAWRRIRAQRDAEAAAFIPVRVEAEHRSISDSSVEVILSNGRRLRLGPGFDAATLRHVVAALEEVPPC